jgi:hypothetical protein
MQLISKSGVMDPEDFAIIERDIVDELLPELPRPV